MDRLVHFEIPFDDEDRAKKFYKQLFRWEIKPMPVKNMEDYQMAMTGPSGDEAEPGYINGGLAPREETFQSPMLVINVKSIDSVLKMVESIGGTIMTQTVEVGDFGLYARIQDSEGNIIGIWEDIKK